MPCPAAQATCTVPVAGAGNWNTYGPFDTRVTFVAGWELISRSAALTPLTSSLNVTSIWVSVRTTPPPGGNRLNTVGGTVSTSVYCQVAPGAAPSNGLGGSERSVIP